MIIIYCPECGNEVNENDKFCPKCGKPIIAKDKLNGKTTNDENKSITIKFRYSSSRNYKRAIDIASNFDSYNTEGKDKDIEHSVTIPLTEINYIFNLMDLISNWKTAEFYLDGKAVSKSDIYRPLNCYKEKVESYDQQRYCFGEEDYNMNFWGCKKLNMPFNRYSAQSGWLSYGQFNDSNEWVFNKDKIYHELMKNIKEYEICPALNVENVKEKFKKFPQKINPTKNKNWDYITNYKEVNGQFREVATGIYPKLENDNFIFMDNVEINNNYSNVNEEIYVDNITKEKTAKSNKEENMSKTTWEHCPKCQSNNVKKIPNHYILIGFWIFSILSLIIYRPVGFVISFITLIYTLVTPFVKPILLKCNDCNNSWWYKKEKTNQGEKIDDEEYLIGAKKGSHLKKALIILLTLMLPPIGIFFVFKSKRFKTTGKVIASIWLVLFLIVFLVDTSDKNTSEVTSQQTQQEVVENNTEKPQSILSKMINGSDDKKDYNAIIDFIDQNPTMGKFVYYEEISPWAKGKRYSVSTKSSTYLFYLHNNNVVGVWAKDDNGIKHQVYHEDIPGLPKNIERASTETLPMYTIIDQVDLMSGGRYGDILITSYSTKTPMDKRKKTLRTIMKKEGFTEASLYCTKEAYKANINSSYNESHPGVLDKGYLGGVLYDGKFHGPIN